MLTKHHSVNVLFLHCLANHSIFWYSGKCKTVFIKTYATLNEFKIHFGRLQSRIIGGIAIDGWIGGEIEEGWMDTSITNPEMSHRRYGK